MIMPQFSFSRILAYLCVVFLFWGASACQKRESGRVRVRFHNLTGHALNNLEIEGVNLGKLPSGAKTAWSYYPVLNQDGQYIYAQVQAELEGEQVYNQLGFCATMLERHTRGRYEVEIWASQTDPATSKNRLYLLLRED